MAAFELHDLTLGYAGHPAMRHLSGCFEVGSLTAIVGPNGSGKSTLLKGLAGLLKPMAGKIERKSSEKSDLAYLPQSGELDLGFPATVTELVGLGLWAKRGLFKAHIKEDRNSVAQAITKVGLQGFESRQINSLSGGQLQRALFARLILQDSRVILLDEPFTAIDESTTEDLMNLITQWHNDGRTVLAVLHDFAVVKRHFPQTLLLAGRPVAWGATADVMSADNLGRVQNFVEAWDETASDCEVEAA
ncbi:MAG: zinc ABC transporter ATP-binding protein AztA [Aestuariivirga sp.]